MRVYIAADSSQQPTARLLRDCLERDGIVVTSRWLDVVLEAERPSELAAGLLEKELEKASVDNFDDIDRAQFLVLWNPKITHRSGTGGRHVETGYALGRFKTVIYIGERLENVFHRHPGVRATLDPSSYNSAHELAVEIANVVKLLWNGTAAKVSER